MLVFVLIKSDACMRNLWWSRRCVWSHAASPRSPLTSLFPEEQERIHPSSQRPSPSQYGRTRWASISFLIPRVNVCVLWLTSLAYLTQLDEQLGIVQMGVLDLRRLTNQLLWMGLWNSSPLAPLFREEREQRLSFIPVATALPIPAHEVELLPLSPFLLTFSKAFEFGVEVNMMELETVNSMRDCEIDRN